MRRPTPERNEYCADELQYSPLLWQRWSIVEKLIDVTALSNEATRVASDHLPLVATLSQYGIDEAD